jgi:hypothetical protein
MFKLRPASFNPARPAVGERTFYRSRHLLYPPHGRLFFVPAAAFMPLSPQFLVVLRLPFSAMTDTISIAAVKTCAEPCRSKTIVLQRTEALRGFPQHLDQADQFSVITLPLA